jgi:TolB-like protein
MPAASPLADKPSIAVLPFANMSGDPEQDFFADGIAEDLITALSRCPSLFVIARNSCFTYRGQAVDVNRVGRELGVRYVLEGSLRKIGNRVRVTVQLVETEAGKHVWAERYDRDVTDIFAVQDEITEAVTIAIAPAIANAKQRRALRKQPRSFDAWAAYQHGLCHVRRANQADNALAQKFFQNHRAAALYFCREYDAPLDTIKDVMHFYPRYPHLFRWWAASLGQLGRIDEAEEALKQAVTIAPAVFDLYVRERAPRLRPEVHAHPNAGRPMQGGMERAMAAIRRLAAIPAADVTGYSRLMGADEEGTHERLKGHLRELVTPKTGEHRGPIVKNTGDGLLSEFASVVDAVRRAVSPSAVPPLRTVAGLASRRCR